MDGARFDRIARSLTPPGTRRGVLGGLLAGSFTLLGVATGQEAHAKNCKKIENKKKREKCLAKTHGTCKKGTKPCGRRCILTAACCPATEKVCNGRCIPAEKCCSNAECNGGVCAGVCQKAPNQGICTPERNACLLNGGAPACGTPAGSYCTCIVRPNGLSFCGRLFFPTICTTDEQCVAAQGPGAVCVTGTSSLCASSETGTGCVTPCPTPQ
jgi:hypothetical protein